MRSAFIDPAVRRMPLKGYRQRPWMASTAAEFGHCADLLSQDLFGLAPLHFDQVLRLIVVHDMDESELSALGLRQEAGSS